MLDTTLPILAILLSFPWTCASTNLHHTLLVCHFRMKSICSNQQNSIRALQATAQCLIVNTNMPGRLRNCREREMHKKIYRRKKPVVRCMRRGNTIDQEPQRAQHNDLGVFWFLHNHGYVYFAATVKWNRISRTE